MFLKPIFTLPLLVITTAVVIGVACTSSTLAIPAPATPEPIAPPVPIILPTDSAAHNARLEWWYYSGHLTNASGERLGYHFVLFKQQPNNIPSYLAQFSITVPGQGVHKDAFVVAVGERAGGPETFSAELSGWHLTIDDNRHTLVAQGTDGDYLRLQATPTRPPMIHHEDGWFEYLGWSYYYSHPRMATSGEISVNGQPYTVTGETWFDHQWGDFYVVGAPAGWQWFAIMLDDGSALKVTQGRDTSGKTVLEYATHQTAEGKTRHIEGKNEILLEQVRYWQSPHTQARYPVAWNLSVPSLALELTVAAVLNDQEVTAGLPPISIYWEGQTTVTGSLNGSPLEGRGYTELIGYVTPPPLQWRTPEQ